MSMLTQNIAMGAVVNGSVWIRKGPANKALPTLVIPPRLFAGRDPADELRDRLRTLEAGGYRILPWEDRQNRRGKPNGSTEPVATQEPVATPEPACKPPFDFPRLYARVKSIAVTPVCGAGPRIAEHFGEAVSLALVRPGDAVTIDPVGGIQNLFFALTEAMAGRLLLADDEGNLVEPIPWLKASGLLGDPGLIEAARRFGLLGAMSLLGTQAAEAWFA